MSSAEPEHHDAPEERVREPGAARRRLLLGLLGGVVVRREEACELRGRVVAGARATGLGELAERDELRAGAADVVPPRARGLDLGEEVRRPRLAGGLGGPRHDGGPRRPRRRLRDRAPPSPLLRVVPPQQCPPARPPNGRERRAFS